MEDSNEVVEVLDLTFHLAVPGVNGEPAKLVYTVREHLGDKVAEAPGALSIHYGERKQGERTLPGKVVTLQSSWFIGMEREVRLEKKVRPSIAKMIDPRRELKERMQQKAENEPPSPFDILKGTVADPRAFGYR